MFIHDIIKIKYIHLGYLPNYPYHLISDDEMFDAFISYTDYENTFFPHMYPNYDIPSGASDVFGAWGILFDAISSAITEYRTGQAEKIPDWVYSYMLGVVVGPRSEKRDIHDVIYPLGADNPDDDFTRDAALKCYEESKEYLRKIQPSTDDSKRPPTMFGEPHVIKSIRLKQQLL